MVDILPADPEVGMDGDEQIAASIATVRLDLEARRHRLFGQLAEVDRRLQLVAQLDALAIELAAGASIEDAAAAASQRITLEQATQIVEVRDVPPWIQLAKEQPDPRHDAMRGTVLPEATPQENAAMSLVVPPVTPEEDEAAAAITPIDQADPEAPKHHRSALSDKMRAEVLDYLRARPGEWIGSHEIAEAIGNSPTSVSDRLKELVADSEGEHNGKSSRWSRYRVPTDAVTAPATSAGDPEEAGVDLDHLDQADAAKQLERAQLERGKFTPPLPPRLDVAPKPERGMSRRTARALRHEPPTRTVLEPDPPTSHGDSGGTLQGAIIQALMGRGRLSASKLATLLGRSMTDVDVELQVMHGLGDVRPTGHMQHGEKLWEAMT